MRRDGTDATVFTLGPEGFVTLCGGAPREKGQEAATRRINGAAKGRRSSVPTAPRSGIYATYHAVGTLAGPQHATHLWLFLTPMPSSSLIVSGNGEMRCTGPFAMSTVV